MDGNTENKETVQNFGDMVNGVDRLTKPWRIALIVTNILWSAIVALLIWFAYMTPIDASQEQDFTQQTQSQSYSEGVTNGD